MPRGWVPPSLDPMKHFTPERYLRFESLDDREAFLAAQDEWEKALTAYREQLQRIRKELPPHNRSLRGFVLSVHSVYLHDARVLAMYRSEEDFVITLQPPSDPDRLTVLSYKLVGEPSIGQDVLPPERCREQIEWLYDELDLDGPEPTLRHNILLSNGWEVTLRFRWARVKRPLRVIPVLSEPRVRPAAEPRSA
jgi:hypothetical protein